MSVQQQADSEPRTVFDTTDQLVTWLENKHGVTDILDVSTNAPEDCSFKCNVIVVLFDKDHVLSALDKSNAEYQQGRSGRYHIGLPK